MKNRSKLIFKVSLIIIGIGLIYSAVLPIVQAVIIQKVYGSIDTARVEEEQELTPFQNIKIAVGDAQISFIDSGIDGPYKIELVYFNTQKLEYKDNNGTLDVWSEPVVKRIYFSGFFGNNYSYQQNFQSSVKIYCPTGTIFQDVSIANGDGDITLAPLTAATVNLKADYGALYAEGITADTATIVLDSGNGKLKETYVKALAIQNDYGDITLENSKDSFISSSIDIEIDSGDLTIWNMKTAAMNLKNDYGKIKMNTVTADSGIIDIDSGDLIMDKVSGDFHITSSYGDINGKNVAFSNLTISSDDGNINLEGLLENGAMIESDYGDVTLTVDKTLPYGYDLYTDYGNISIDGNERKSRHGKDEEEYYKAGEKMIQVYCDNGIIDIK